MKVVVSVVVILACAVTFAAASTSKEQLRYTQNLASKQHLGVQAHATATTAAKSTAPGDSQGMSSGPDQRLATAVANGVRCDGKADLGPKAKPLRTRDWGDIKPLIPKSLMEGMPKLSTCTCQSPFRAAEAAEMMRGEETFEQCQVRKCGYCENYMEYTQQTEISDAYPEPDADDVCYGLMGWQDGNGHWGDCNQIRHEIWALPYTVHTFDPDTKEDVRKEGGWTRIRQMMNELGPMKDIAHENSGTRKISQGVCYFMGCCPEPTNDK
eukprot:GFYU01003661.1.p1 GENE.GFYU01003661.1~~GFYU01003661.1.p1  ORF type:complete len:268 (-),score=74.83 GFYU01003661.1:342-1145(-)